MNSSGAGEGKPSRAGKCIHNWREPVRRKHIAKEHGLRIQADQTRHGSDALIEAD